MPVESPLVALPVKLNMCLAVVAIHALPDWPLIIAANRDEFHVRPASVSQPWQDAPEILAGRDLKAGGTWLGVSRQGRIALLTNYREPGRNDPDAPSRGRLVEDYLRGPLSASHYASSLQASGQTYNGFNLLLADEDGMWYWSNRAPATRLTAGVVGLSNATLGTPWPKLTRTSRAVSRHLEAIQGSGKTSARGAPDTETLFNIFRDPVAPADHELPDTGVGLERERMLASPFIISESYGTRCTTLVLKRADGQIFFHERRYDPSGQASGQSDWLVDTNQTANAASTAISAISANSANSAHFVNSANSANSANSVS